MKISFHLKSIKRKIICIRLSLRHYHNSRSFWLLHMPDEYKAAIQFDLLWPSQAKPSADLPGRLNVCTFFKNSNFLAARIKNYGLVFSPTNFSYVVGGYRCLTWRELNSYLGIKIKPLCQFRPLTMRVNTSANKEKKMKNIICSWRKLLYNYYNRMK